MRQEAGGRCLTGLLRRQLDTCGGQSADYLVVQSVTRDKYAVLAGELAQLGDGVAERSHLFLGEAPEAGHEDFLLGPQQVEHDGGSLPRCQLRLTVDTRDALGTLVAGGGPSECMSLMR